jgi:hypothetical protein
MLCSGLAMGQSCSSLSQSTDAQTSEMMAGWYALACMLEMSKRDCRWSGLGKPDACS